MKRFGKFLLLVTTLILLLGLCILPAQAASQDDNIVITAPTAGSTVNGGSSYQIQWSIPAGPFNYSVLLQYSLDGGATWADITNISAGMTTSSYFWTVPNVSSSSAVVRVKASITLALPPYNISVVYNDSGEFSIKKASSPIIPLNPDLPLLKLLPNAPENLTAEALSSSKVELTWDDNSSIENGFKLERATGSGSFSQIASLDEDEEEYTDDSVAADKTYRYRIRAYSNIGNSDYSSVFTVDTPPEEEEEEVVENDSETEASVALRFTIGSKSYKWNGTTQAMDVSPIIKESRTLLPIRYVADPLGAQVLWNTIEGKVTIKTDSKTIEMWINNNTAKVNGSSVKIDSNNANVTPVIIPPGRTMLPLRFIADNLDCDVVWNAADKSIKVSYPK